MGLTQGFETLRTKVAQKFHPDSIVELSPLTWEERILPVLMELEKITGIEKVFCKIQNESVLYIGNNRAYLPTLNIYIEDPRTTTPQQESIFLYLFHPLKDLSTLRRLKDYPDETDAAELLNPWIGECPQYNSIVLVNPNL